MTLKTSSYFSSSLNLRRRQEEFPRHFRFTPYNAPVLTVRGLCPSDSCLAAAARSGVDLRETGPPRPWDLTRPPFTSGWDHGNSGREGGPLRMGGYLPPFCYSE